MLTSIRDAIHEETAREAEEHARTFKTKPVPDNLKPQAGHAAAPAVADGNRNSVSGSMRELRVSLQPAGQSHRRGTITARSQDFLSLKNKLASLRQDQPEPGSGGDMERLMGGDVRLEDAVERMNTAEQLQRQNTPVPLRAEAQSMPDDGMAMRGATLDDMPGEPSDIAYSDYEAPDEDYDSSPDMMAPEFVAAPGHPEAMEAGYVEAAMPVAADEVATQLVDHTAMHHEPVEPAVIHPAPVQPAPLERAMVMPSENRHLPSHADRAAMVSGKTMRATDSALDLLSKELFGKTSGGAQVLEESARDMIKPMLKNWLDDNLPKLVERLVREEIERVVRKGGR